MPPNSVNGLIGFFVYENQKQLDIVLKNAIPPAEQIFMQGQFFDAYKLFSDLIRSANKRVVIIDNYVDESVLELLRKRNAGVVHDRFMIIDDVLYSSGGSIFV